MSDQEKMEKHKGWLRKRQRASDLGQSFSTVRKANDINDGKDDDETSQRRDTYSDGPVKLNLRNFRRQRRGRD